ncbi:hypothetical protein F5148DRAFT_593335 [Russula earlei]|uniref:Uncharacterized protein n=1 Tax=Russula earlei TaxID=71964 RepID=A0ACC0UGF9_9AGAM|nr:hypothetical protein F5148DRAFT_593335 [Russula earlei]
MPSDLNQPSPARAIYDCGAGWRGMSTACQHAIRGRLATAGTDNMVKIWIAHEDETSRKRHVSISRRPRPRSGRSCVWACSGMCSSTQGEGSCVVWSPDDSLTLAAARSKAKLQIWDVGANFGARKVFGARLGEAARARLKRMIVGGGGGAQRCCG